MGNNSEAEEQPKENQDQRFEDSGKFANNENAPPQNTQNEPDRPSVRAIAGQGSIALSDWVSEHLTETRFVATTTIGLLALYGVSQTPLFFRYRTVADLPSSLFRQRKCIRGRLVKVWLDKPSRNEKKAATAHLSSQRATVSKLVSSTPPQPTQPTSALSLQPQSSQQQEHLSTSSYPIQCQIRHSSPMEALLSKSLYDAVMKWYPTSSILGKRPDEVDDQLLTVEIAGIRSLSIDPSSHQNPSSTSLLAGMSSELLRPQNSSLPSEQVSEIEWLERLAQERPLVSCQLLGRRVPISADSNTPYSGAPPKKRKIPDFEGDKKNDGGRKSPQDGPLPSPRQIAIGRFYYRSPSSSVWDNMRQIVFPTDLALSMVRLGRATVLPEDESLVSTPTTKKSNKLQYRLLDTSDTVRDLQKDSQYIEELHKAEYQAVAEQRGMWQNSDFLQLRGNVVKEVEFQSKAKWWQKLWRWMRGG